MPCRGGDHEFKNAGNPRPPAERSIRGGAYDVEAFARSYGGVTVSRLKAGTLLYSQAEPDNAMYCLREGQTQITVVSSDGRKVSLMSSIRAASLAKVACSATVSAWRLPYA